MQRDLKQASEREGNTEVERERAKVKKETRGRNRRIEERESEET